nr:tetratricopeptide repeat protein [Pseudomonas sp.]
MTLTDARGLATSTTNAASLDGYERSLALLHGYYGDPLSVIDEAIENDPAFMLGHLLRAALLITAGDNSVEPLLRESVEKAEKLAGMATERERRHLFAARAWLQHDFDKSVRAYGDIAVDYPRDSLALQIAHIGDFLLGQSAMLRDRIARALPAWSDADPEFSYLLGMHAFGLEETNLYEAAEEQGRRALELNRRDPWAV